MKRITITAGVGMDEYGHKLKPWYVEEQIAHLRQTFAEVAGGFTEVDTLGGWQSGHQYAQELGKRFIILYDGANPHLGRDLAERVRAALLQESVVLEEETVNVQFVTKERTHEHQI